MIVTMSGPVLILNITLYGSEHSRLEIELRPRLPSASLARNPGEAQLWASMLVNRVTREIKHSGPWECEFCGKPARETIIQVAPHMHLNPPMLAAYAHCICDADPGPCKSAVDATRSRFDGVDMSPGSMHPHIPKAPGQHFALHASCAGCETDETADVRLKPGEESRLMRCSGCHVTRYYGILTERRRPECQRRGWKRHKEFCKIFKAARWADGT